NFGAAHESSTATHVHRIPSSSACSSSCGLANGPCRRDTVVRNYRYAALSSDFSLTTIRGSLCARKPTPNRLPPRGEGGGNLEPCVCYFNLVDRRSYLQDGCPIPHRIDDRVIHDIHRNPACNYSDSRIAPPTLRSTVTLTLH